ncbi:tRNA (adenosine(37)-N6)-dimethylallyltransferase MiaA [Neisseriaceae bacterium PsAf]|nr:tRNA (adenosine(37)-N6)-dimethylallyltransferase MiaA [Neisseriaceae bacterium PsAf]
MKQAKVLAIIGPTASGKTNLALELATRHSMEIISLDSALIYQDMDIGTAKPNQEELKLVPHHLINIITPLQSYDVANFVDDCSRLINEINDKGKIALIVGGTMMYYNALVNGLNQLPTADDNIRSKIQDKKNAIGIAGLYQELLDLDPLSANRIKPSDSQRIERALEVFYISGKSMSYFFNQQQKQHQAKNIPTIALMPDNRLELHQHIELRFLQMLKLGFIDEVIEIKQKYPELDLNYPSMRCVGYRQIWEYLDGVYSKNEMIDKGIIATRQLAKRQLTWLRKFNPEVVIDPYLPLQDKRTIVEKFMR